MARLTRVEQQEQTRLRMLAAADRLFAERGYLATTVEDIADEAGHTRSAVYKVLGGKESIFFTCAERRTDEQIEQWRQRLEAATTDEQCLRTFAELVVAEMHGPDGWARAMVEFAGAAGSEESRQRMLRLQQATDARAANLVTTLCRRIGSEPPVPASELALLVVALANGLLPRAQLDPGFNLTQTLTDGLHLLLRPERMVVPATGSPRRKPANTAARALR